MRLYLPLIFCLAACANDLPDSRDTISAQAQNAPYPKLVPLGPILARSEAGSTVEDQSVALEARVAALKSRANALKGRSIIDGADRLRLLRRRG